MIDARKTLHRIVASARKAALAFVRPESGQIIWPEKTDLDRDYVTAGLTPTKLVSVLKDFDDGDLASGLNLIEEIEEKDTHIGSVAATRRVALTGLPWEIVSAADVRDIEDRTQADKAADYCREVLTDLDSFDAVLPHLALGIGRSISVAELVWEDSRLANIVPVLGSRLTYDTTGDTSELRILTKEESSRGVAMEPNKFIIHTPHNVSGLPMRGGLLRMTAACYLAKALSLKSWMIFLEVFGMPVRVARYEPTASKEEKIALLKMLQSLGTDAAGVFSKAVELEFIQAKLQGELPFERAAKFFNAEASKAWLGQTLTTEQGDRGSQSLGRVHNDVREDLRDEDIAAEGRTIRNDLLRPLVEGEYGTDVVVPYFRRRIEGASDVRELTDVVDKAVNDLGLMVDKKWFAAEVGVKLTDKDDEALQPTKPASPFDGLSLSDRKRLVLADRNDDETDTTDTFDVAEEYADEATNEADSLFGPLVEQVQSWFDKADEDTPAASLYPVLIDRIPQMGVASIAALADVVRSLMLASNLLGRLAVKEAFERHSSRRVLAEAAPIERLPFEAAVAALRQRVAIPTPAFRKLGAEAQARAFTVARIASIRLISDIHDAIVQAVEAGETGHEFRRRLPQALQNNGWLGMRSWHADLIFRQQSVMAYSAGRYTQMQEVGITHWRYSALRDSRTRPTHAALDGRIFEMSDRRFYPPWEFQCRCVAEPMFDDELPGATVDRSDDLVGQRFATDANTGEPLAFPSQGQGFRFDPARFANIEPLRLDSIDNPQLRDAFRLLLDAERIAYVDDEGDASE